MLEISQWLMLVISNLWMESNRQSLEGHEGADGRGHRISVMQSTQKHGDPKQPSLRYLIATRNTYFGAFGCKL